MEVLVNAECCVNPINELFTLTEPFDSNNRTTLLDKVVYEIIGSRKYRRGCYPDNDTQIKRVIAENMAQDLPIPILIAWGASKQGEYGIDLAEAMALKQLWSLGQRVGRLYAPGVDIRIRLEDAVDPILFDVDWVKRKTYPYCVNFIKLVKIMVPTITVLLESDLVDYLESEDYYRISRIFFHCLTTGDDSLLETIGWLNGLPIWQVNHYKRAMDSFYHDKTEDEKLMLLSNYFATVVVRRIFNATGATRESILLSFGDIIPNDKNDRRIFYRTNSGQHNHRAPWLGKGCICNGDVYVNDWRCVEEYEEHSIVVSGNNQKVRIGADYVLGE